MDVEQDAFYLREAFKKKNPKLWKKSKRGGRGQLQKSKSPKFEIWSF